jgi:alpha-beta hydrolase superfamily lysophospholipase
VTKTEGTFPGVRGTRIAYRRWLPDAGSHAVLLLVHGLAEHCGRYNNVVRHFVPRGYAVCGADHVGHGRSGGRRVHVRRFADFVDVLDQFSKKVSAWHPRVPQVLLGHSLGALIAATFLLDRSEAISAAVLSGPLVAVPENISPVTILVSRILSGLVPWLGIAAVDATGVSRDPEVVAAYLGDPLVHTGKTTARLGCEILRAIRRLEQEATQIAIPLLVLQGSNDRLVPPAGAEQLYRHAGSKDKTFKTYAGLHHEIYNEPERATVLADVEAWLSDRLDLNA